MPAHDEKPDLGFEGKWDGDYYSCKPVKGWGAVLYELGGTIQIHFFPTRDNPLKEDYVKSVLGVCRGKQERPQHHNLVPDWLTAVCLLHQFVEEHTDD